MITNIPITLTVTQHHIRSTAPVTNGPACRITPTGSSQDATLALSWLSSRAFPSSLEASWQVQLFEPDHLGSERSLHHCGYTAWSTRSYTTALVILPTLCCASSRHQFSMIINLAAQRQFETLFSFSTIAMNNEHNLSSLWNTLAHWVPWSPTQCPLISSNFLCSIKHHNQCSFHYC